jgi:hypothetical protein
MKSAKDNLWRRTASMGADEARVLFQCTVEVLGWAARLWAHWSPLSFDAYVMQVRSRPSLDRRRSSPS